MTEPEEDLGEVSDESTFKGRFHKFSLVKQIKVFAILTFLFSLVFVLLFAAISYFFDLEKKSILQLIYLFMATVASLFCLYFYSYKSPIKQNTRKIILHILDALYFSFVTFSSLCFTRITVSLPLIFKNNVAEEAPKESSKMTNSELSANLVSHLSLDFLYSFCMIIILIFIAFRLVLNLFDKVPSFRSTIRKWKTIWKNTMISWAAIFTVLTTVASLWIGRNA